MMGPNTLPQDLTDAIRDHLSPEAVAMIFAFLQPVGSSHDEGRKAAREVEWFADGLSAMLGADECNRLMDEIGV